MVNWVLDDRAVRQPGAQRLDGRHVTFSATDKPAAYPTFQVAVSLARE